MAKPSARLQPNNRGGELTGHPPPQQPNHAQHQVAGDAKRIAKEMQNREKQEREAGERVLAAETRNRSSRTSQKK